ncbi:MAG: hypothetical protein LBL49_06895 [Clostridiales Family XIII bacterium]|nr:hypothetical protein [Clostridiales Family XIII bacterium]
MSVTLVAVLVATTVSSYAGASVRLDTTQDLVFSVDGFVGAPTESKLAGPDGLQSAMKSEMLASVGATSKIIAIPSTSGNVRLALGQEGGVRS